MSTSEILIESETSRTPNLILMGLPGSGKTTIGEGLASDPSTDLVYISLGQISRKLPEDDPRRLYLDELHASENSPNGDPQFFLDLVRPVIEKAVAERKGIILDGLPKKEEEVEPLTEMLQDIGVRIDGIVFCEINPFLSMKRIRERGDRGNNAETEETAINRGVEYWRSKTSLLKALGGHAGRKIINVNTEELDPDTCVRTA